MDRYAYLPVGRRRAWLIGSQACSVETLPMCALLNPGEQRIALLSAFGGILISGFKFSVALITVAEAVSLVLLMAIVQCERPGEKLLPWSQGQASAISLELHQGAWLPI